MISPLSFSGLNPRRLFASAWRNAPVPMAFSTLFSIALIIAIYADYGCNSSRIIFSGLGLLFTAVATSWSRKRGKAYYFSVFAAILLAAANAYYYCYVDQGIQRVTAVSFTSILAFTAIFFPPRRCHTSESFTLITAFFKCLLISVLFAIAILIIGVSLEFLFNIGSSVERFLASVCVCLSVFTPITLFLGHFNLRTLSPDAHVPEIYSRLGSFVFYPVLIIYVVILYVYGVKILSQWSLPNGYLCTCVSIFLGGWLLTMFLNQNNQQSQKLVVPMAWAAIPLMLLMSIAIGVRIADYGLTGNRIYVLIANLLGYVTIAMVISRRFRFNVIIAPSLITFFAVSAIPGFNLCLLSHKEEPGTDLEYVFVYEHRTVCADSSTKILLPPNAVSLTDMSSQQVLSSPDDSMATVNYNGNDFAIDIQSLRDTIKVDDQRAFPTITLQSENNPSDYIILTRIELVDEKPTGESRLKVKGYYITTKIQN
ncbi:MAG: DUF4153 domain-containing protein [Bacteroidales bacterium]|nr:DUF4153 domain-containing protein [Bacteroidales bacterium]